MSLVRSNIFQLNAVTHYLDLSHVYGSNDEVAASLRAGFGGRLNVDLKSNREFPPQAPNKTTMCDTMHEYETCYVTGKRTNINVGVYARQFNRRFFREVEFLVFADAQNFERNFFFFPEKELRELD